MSAVKFLEEHDPKVKFPKLLKAALADLRKSEGHEAWRYEQPLSQMSGVALVYLQKLRTHPDFAKLVVETPRSHKRNPKFAWFVDAKVAAEMRARLKESL